MANHNGNEMRGYAAAIVTALVSVGAVAAKLVTTLAKNSIDHNRDQDKFNKLTADIDDTNFKIKEKSSGLGALFNRNEINDLKNDLSDLSNERSGLFNKKK